MRATAACPLIDSCKETSIVFEGDMIWATLSVVDPDSGLGLLIVTGVPRKPFFATADATLLTTIMVAVGCCVLLVVGCVLLLWVIYQPIASLGVNMMLAAELHNDRVEHTRTYLRDISKLSSIFDQMNQQLLVARSFVPEAVLLGKTEDSQEGNDADDEGSVAEGTASRSQQSHVKSVEVTATEGTGQTTSSGGNITKLFNIAEKRVGVLSLNLVGFHEMCAPSRQSNRTRRMQDITTSLLTLAVASSHGERGVMDSFHGDHFTITFNASRVVAGPLAAAVRTGNSFIRQVRAELNVAAGSVAAGAAVSRAHVGTFGIDGYRRMSVIGDGYRAATALQLAAVQLLRMSQGRVGEGVFVGSSALKELGSGAFHLQAVGLVQTSQLRSDGSKGGDEPDLLFSAVDVACNAEADDEWLYELDAIRASDPFVRANEAMFALLSGEVGECQAIVDAAPAESISQIPGSFSQSATSMEFGKVSVREGPVPPISYVAWCLDAYKQHEKNLGAAPLSSVARRLPLPYVTFQQ